MSQTDSKQSDGVPDLLEEEDEILEHLGGIEEMEGLSPGEHTVRVLSAEADANNTMGRLVGVIDAAAVLEAGEVPEAALTAPLQ